MSKVNTLWAIAIGLVVVGAALEWRFHNSAAQDVPIPTINSWNAPVPATKSTQGSNDHRTQRETVEAISSAPANADSKPVQIADAEQPVFDRDFAAAAAKPYVEAYQRAHPPLNDLSFAWNQARVVFVPAPDGSNVKGYLGVFFPRSGSSGVGFTCFNVEDDAQDHLTPMSWGYAPDLSRAIENIRHGAVERNGCFTFE
jgi:hypothetical protein